ncbi:MAG: radical SAM protein [Candidatus Pacearchaeota archaeon]|nr:radical SAM protein [Candidatus Pacearchaeota archaeon]
MSEKHQTNKRKEQLITTLIKTSVFLPIGRTVILDYLERITFKSIVENARRRLKEVQKKKFYFIKALLRCAFKNLERGYISKEVGKKIIDTLVRAHWTEGKYEISAREKFKNKYGFGPPSFLVLSPTQRCNLRCPGCYAAAKRNAPSLSFSIVERIVKEAHDILGNRFMVISGGEPFMYESEGKTLFDIWEKYNDMFFLVYTNGTLINKEIASKLAKLGNVTPAISMEGFEEDTDKRRGKGIFKKILEVASNLREAGVPFGASLTATRENINTLLKDEFYEFLFEKLGVTYIWLFQLMPIGRARIVKELMLTPEQRVALFKKWVYLLEKKSYCIADFWNSGVLSDGCIAYGRTGGYFYIDWNGNIMPCVFIPYYEDNVFQLYKEGKTIADALFSEFFKRGRKWQDEYGFAHQSNPNNWLMPCSIRDHYVNFKKNILTKKAKPEDRDASIAIKSKNFEKFLDAFDKKLAELTDSIWKREYLAKGLTSKN